MSDSTKKKLIQKKLPFALSVEPKKVATPTPTENLSPNIVKQSRKRRPSTDGNQLAKKRVTESKENQEIVDVEMLADDVIESTEEVQAIKKSSETTPTTVQRESVLHIKLPSHSKLKRKVNMDLKPPKAIDESHEDDSVVYLDEEELQPVKKAKKSEKKKKTSPGSSRAKRTLNTSKEASPIATVIELSDDEAIADDSNEKVDEKLVEKESEVKLTTDEKKVETVAETLELVEAKDQEKVQAPKVEEPLESIPTQASSPAAEDPDTIHDEIIDMLSDDSNSSTNKTFDANKTPANKKIDFKTLTPKQLARRQELEARRVEKELQRQKERDEKEQQRIKEKEQREEAKRKEKEEKEQARKKEKDERDQKRQVSCYCDTLILFFKCQVFSGRTG